MQNNNDWEDKINNLLKDQKKEEIRGSTKIIATLLDSLYIQLRKKNFSDEQSFELVKVFFHTFFSNRKGK